MRKVSLLAVAIAATFSVAHAAEIEKIVLPAGTQAPAGYEQIADYGSYSVYRGNPAAMPRGVSGAYVLAEADLLQFDRMRLDTRQSAIEAPAGFTLTAPSGAALQLVQFVGPLKGEWLDQVRATSAVPVHYIESNGYLIWATASARSALAGLVAENKVLQFSQPLPSFVKLGTSLFDRVQRGEAGAARIPITVQMYRHDAGATSKRALEALGLKPESDWSPVLGYENAKFSASLEQIRQIIELPDVFWVGEIHPRTLNDEVQAQIVRGYFNGDQSGPQAEGYLPWLNALGFSTDPAAYPILDITDDGVGNRTTTSGDPTLHVLGLVGNASRVVFNQHCGSAATNGNVRGHGHINANIALGYDLRANATTPGARFPAEYQRGLGINPYGRIGGTRIFNSSNAFDQSGCGNTDAGVIRASYVAGARISSNSWGCSGCASSYDDGSQAYDVGTRDADLTTAGNQQLITVFSAGNSGSSAGTVGTPGNGKNMITVGASENPRPLDEGGAWNDGCQIGPNGADDAMDVIFFSSRGPAPGARIKPDLIAPGTHVTGTRPDPGNGIGICDPSHPLGNSTYAAASGTSHSTPAVSGVASLAWWWIANAQGSLEFDEPVPSVPSPALTKAWLIAHPTYLTGEGANDDLPSNAQGYGMPNLGEMFSDAPKWLLNQSQVLAESGQIWTAQFEPALPLAPVRIVLAWTDAPGAVGTSPQVNNLDLEVTRGSTLFHGNHFSGAWSTPGGGPDTANNVEAVFLPTTSGPFTVQVRGFNIGGDGVPGNADSTDQDFALVCTNCAQEPSFAFGLKPAYRSACTTATGSLPWTISVSPILGFQTPVSLALSQAPPGSSSDFSVNPLPVPSLSTLTLSNLASVPAGSHTIAVQGEAQGLLRTRYSRLDLFDEQPGEFALAMPEPGAANVVRRPLFHWQPAAQAARYRLEVALDAGFSNVVHVIETQATSHTLESDLEYETRYYWRVTGTNDCGSTSSTDIGSFTTTPIPGECAAGAVAQAVSSTDFENGGGDWVSSGSHNTWAISSARSRSGSRAYLGQDVPFRSDQRLTSPLIALPLGRNPLILEFWTHQTLENRIGGCYDGALLEISRDKGANWTQISDSQIAIGRHDGPISTSFNNPAGGKLAWCGDPRDWTRSVVTLDGYAGDTVQFRFRLATDASTGRLPDGFYLDDVLVQSCVGPEDAIFADGFEMP